MLSIEAIASNFQSMFFQFILDKSQNQRDKDGQTRFMYIKRVLNPNHTRVNFPTSPCCLKILIQNQYGTPLTISFPFDSNAHIHYRFTKELAKT